MGSSRTCFGIDPEIIREKTDLPVYNYGLSGGTFLHNTMMAYHLIDEYQPEKIFIELSPAIQEFNPLIDYYNIPAYNAVSERYSPANQMFYLKDKLDALLNVQRSLKDLRRDTIDVKLGYVPTLNNTYDRNDSFLKMEDISIHNDVETKAYHELISELSTYAKTKDVEITFYLPLTFNRNSERKLTTTIYSELDDTKRLKLDNDFLRQIADPHYLRDKNHLNSKGAKIYSDYLARILAR